MRRWIESANNAIEGILHAAQTQRHLRYHFYASGTVLTGSYILGVTRNEFILIALAVIAVLVAEMLNTAVEATVDLLSPEHHERARAAKDIAAGAVLITAFGSAVIGYIILFPHLINLFAEGFAIAPRPNAEVTVLSFIMVLITVILVKAYRGAGHPLRGGMPSGHAALSYSLWASVSFSFQSPAISAVIFIVAAIVSYSRIVMGIHHPKEVLAGGVIGALETTLLFMVFT